MRDNSSFGVSYSPLGIRACGQKRTNIDVLRLGTCYFSVIVCAGMDGQFLRQTGL